MQFPRRKWSFLIKFLATSHIVGDIFMDNPSGYEERIVRDASENCVTSSFGVKDAEPISKLQNCIAQFIFSGWIALVGRPPSTEHRRRRLLRSRVSE